MSYDISFGVKVVGAEDKIIIIGEPEYSSPTYNIRDIFVQSMDWDYHQGEWYSMDEVLPKIERGIHELSFNDKKYKHLEPDNGWGSVDSALCTLRSIYGWFANEDGGWDKDIPLNCIYMKW